MIPVIRDREPQPQLRLHSFAKIALGFILGALATYYWMQPGDVVQRPERLETFKLVLDDTNLQHLRRPMDVRHLVVRVPVPPPMVGQEQWQYGTMRNSLLQL